MGSQQVFCLRWSNHQSNMLSVFDELLQTETLVDVTIACEGLSMKAHKVVLSACSPYFQTLFLQNPCKHPIVILKDIKYSELKALIDFMYKGEVNVTQEQLSTLLKTAETLKIKGLAEVTGGVNGQQTDDSDNFSQASFERKVFHGIARSMNPASDSRSSTPPHPLPPPPPPLTTTTPLPLLSGQLSSTMPSHSPPTKRKKMRPKRRSPEANHSNSNNNNNNNEEGENVKVEGSPEMLETKVEVASEELDHVPSRASDHDEQMDQPSDLQTDSNQESLDNPYPNQGHANPSSEEFSAGGEPLPATSPSFTAPLSLLQKLKGPGPSTSSGMSSQESAPRYLPQYLEDSEVRLLHMRSATLRQFATNIARAIFTEDEMRMSNCSGRNRRALDAQKLSFIQCAVQKYFPETTEQTDLDIWKVAVKAIDCWCRHMRRKDRARGPKPPPNILTVIQTSRPYVTMKAQPCPTLEG